MEIVVAVRLLGRGFTPQRPRLENREIGDELVDNSFLLPKVPVTGGYIILDGIKIATNPSLIIGILTTVA